MRRILVAAAAALALAAAVPSQAGGLDLRVGGFFPRVESNLFLDDAALYGTHKSDWQGWTFGAEYSFSPSDRVELGLSLDGYDRHVETSYPGFTTDTGRDIYQTLHFATVPLGGTVRFLFAPSDAKVVPYVGVGGDVVFWEYEEYGDFIDFDSPDLPVIADHFKSDGATPAGHATVGLRFAVNHDFKITAEGKYLLGHVDDMSEDFRGNRIDVSGWSATVGVHMQF